MNISMILTSFLCFINADFILLYKNRYLRILINNDYKKIKLFKNRIENKIKSKMYDYLIKYNSLTDEEREILDTIVGLCY